MSPASSPDLAERLDAALPQTQCRQCGHDGCRPYADAMARGEAIDRCGPGGEDTIAALAAITGRPIIPLAPDVGRPGPLLRAVIDETLCIGCTLCIDACPVDAIAGGAKRMHAVLAALCTGCGLCVAPCPVDCIAMIPAGRRWSGEDADAARARHRAHVERQAQARPAGDEARLIAASPQASEPGHVLSIEERRDAVVAALARARARRERAA